MGRGVRVEEGLVGEFVGLAEGEAQDDVVGLGEALHSPPEAQLVDSLMGGQDICVSQFQSQSTYHKGYLSSTLSVKPTLCSISTCSSILPSYI
jgi:hypothetical protein